MAFIIGGLVSMGMPGLSGFIAEFPIFLGVWQGHNLDFNGVFGLNPSDYYQIVAILAILAVVITAAYVLRAVQSVFFGEYDAEKWHDMRPILGIDKMALITFSVVLILIGVLPILIAPIIQSGVSPVVERLNEAQLVVQSSGGSVSGAAQDFFHTVAAKCPELVWRCISES